MRSSLALAIFLLGVSCKQQESSTAPPPAKKIVSGLELLEYKEPSGTFSALGPADWKVRETSDLGPEVSFIGPGTPKYSNAQRISISRYPNPVDKSGDPKKYYSGLDLGMGYRNISPYTEKQFGAVMAGSYSFEHSQRNPHSKTIAFERRDDVAIVPFPGGFFQIEHSAPVEIYKDTLPIFEAVVASFKPGKLPPPSAEPKKP